MKAMVEVISTMMVTVEAVDEEALVELVLHPRDIHRHHRREHMHHLIVMLITAMTTTHNGDIAAFQGGVASQQNHQQHQGRLQSISVKILLTTRIWNILPHQLNQGNTPPRQVRRRIEAKKMMILIYVLIVALLSARATQKSSQKDEMKLISVYQI